MHGRRWSVGFSAAAAIVICLGAKGTLAQDALSRTAATSYDHSAIASAALAKLGGWLVANQDETGGWGTDEANRAPALINGLNADGFMALVLTGTDVAHPALQKGLKLMLDAKLVESQVFAKRINAFCILLPRLREDEQRLVRARIAADVAILVKAQHPTLGFWGRVAENLRSNWDTLEIDNAVLLSLELADAAVGGVPKPVWQKAELRYLQSQRPDGGWNHGLATPAKREDPSRGSDTAGAISVLTMIRGKLYGPAGCPCSGSRSAARKLPIDKSIDAAIAWLEKNYSGRTDPVAGDERGLWATHLWMNACQKTALSYGIRHFGDNDWMTDLTQLCVGMQTADGRINYWGEHASYLTAVSKKLACQRVQFDGPWNNHQGDLCNLLDFIGGVRGEKLRWRGVRLTDDPRDLFDAPHLLITPESRVELSDQQKQSLRKYTDGGGTILLEASCGNMGARTWIEQLCKEVWPELEGGLQVLPRDHAVWTAAEKVAPGTLQGLNDGKRTIVFYSRSDMSCAWSVNNVRSMRAAFGLGLNVLTYSLADRSLQQWRDEVAKR